MNSQRNTVGDTVGSDLRMQTWQQGLLKALGEPILARVQTTDATATTLATVPVLANTIYYIEAVVLARRTNGSSPDDGAVYVVRGAYRLNGTSAQALDGSTPQATFSSETDAAYGATLVVGTQSVIVQVTGKAAHTLVWTGRVTTLKVMS